MAKLNNSSRLFWLPLLAGVLPLLSTNIGYLWAAALGHVDWCNPYWDSCTSVSRVGRQPPVTLLYRGGIISGAVLMALFWLSAKQIVPTLRAPGMVSSKRLTWISWLGVIGAAALIQYCVALGEAPRIYRLFRYTGVMFGVGCTLAAQVLMVLELKRCPGVPSLQLRRLVWILWGYLAIAILSQGGKLFITGEAMARVWRDAFEWWLFLLMNGWMIVCGIIWRQLRLTVVYDCR